MKTRRAAIGVDLGGTNVRSAVVDSGGRLLGSARSRIEHDRSPGAVLECCAEVIAAALEEAGAGLEVVAEVGVGVAGQVRGSSGVVANAPNLGWSEEPFGPRLAERLGRPVRLVNDLDAIAWGEVRFGAARGHRDALVVFAGTGIGAGLVLGGRPHHGAGGVAGEIGHLKVRPDGAPCGCGGSGCLEAYLGGGNLSRRLRAEAVAGWEALRARCGGDVAGIHPGLVDELAIAGDPRAVGLWEELAEMFGTVLANAVTLVNPSALVMGGTVWIGCPELARRTQQVLLRRVLAVSGEGLAILATSLGDDAGVIGAGALVLGTEEEDA